MQPSRLYNIGYGKRGIQTKGNVVVEFPCVTGSYFVKGGIAAQDHDGKIVVDELMLYMRITLNLQQCDFAVGRHENDGVMV